MWVCESCHNKDKRVVGCKIPTHKHQQIKKSFCEVCDAFIELVICTAYDNHKQSIAAQK